MNRRALVMASTWRVPPGSEDRGPQKRRVVRGEARLPAEVHSNAIINTQPSKFNVLFASGIDTRPWLKVRFLRGSPTLARFQATVYGRQTLEPKRDIEPPGPLESRLAAAGYHWLDRASAQPRRVDARRTDPMLLARGDVFLLLSGSTAARAQDPTTPPPGRLVDVGGWRLHLNCTGEARTSQPIVILEAGAGDFSVDWSLVQPGVARLARVCSYDRAGSGWSELGPRPRTMHQIVYELHTLLDKAGERPPYVLVGHSFGGALVRLYHSRYPADVVSLVLVDAAADNPWRKTPDKGLVRSSDLATGKPIPAVKTSDPLRDSEIPERFVTMIEGSGAAAQCSRKRSASRQIACRGAAHAHMVYAQVKMHISNDNPFEAEELGMLRAQRTRTAPVLGDLPLIVLSRGLPQDSGPAGQKGEEEHNRDQAGLVALSRLGKQVVAKRSGHHIPLDEPDLVVAAIRDVIAAARR